MTINIPQLKKKLDSLQSKDAIRERLVKQYLTLGYEIKPGDIFYKTTLDGGEIWGLKIGQITHSCHIDTTELVVLFFPMRKPDVILMADNWLTDSITI